MKIYIGSDHGGFKLKQALKAFISRLEENVTDLGAFSLDPDDDYPLVAGTLADKISRSAGSRGILICRTGQGVAIVANKFPRVRATLVWNVSSAKTSRTDDDANVLCLPADHLNEKEAKNIVRTWLTTGFKDEVRHRRRLMEIKKIEDRMLKKI